MIDLEDFNCPHCGAINPETWFDRTICYDGNGQEMEYETYPTRCCECGKNVDAPKEYYRD